MMSPTSDSGGMPLTIDMVAGTWTLISATAIDRDGNALPPPYGPQPMGRLVLNAAGRMMAMLCDGRPEVPAGEPRAYSSYCGHFVIDGDMLTTTVDAAAKPERIGSLQRRRLVLEGERLTLFPPARNTGEQRRLVWIYQGPA